MIALIYEYYVSLSFLDQIAGTAKIPFVEALVERGYSGVRLSVEKILNLNCRRRRNKFTLDSFHNEGNLMHVRSPY